MAASGRSHRGLATGASLGVFSTPSPLSRKSASKFAPGGVLCYHPGVILLVLYDSLGQLGYGPLIGTDCRCCRLNLQGPFGSARVGHISRLMT